MWGIPPILGVDQERRGVENYVQRNLNGARGGDHRLLRLPAPPSHRHYAGYSGGIQVPQPGGLGTHRPEAGYRRGQGVQRGTFYENFSLEAKGKYIIKVCDGTACHVRKSQPIYNAIREYLELEDKQKTSADSLFTLETVACLGACGLAPVVTVNDQVHSKMTPELAIELLEELGKEEAAQ